MDKYEQYLGEGGRVVGNAIGWGLRRLYDSFRNAAEKSREGVAPRPGDPNRILPNWEMEVCERSVKTALAYFDCLPRKLRTVVCLNSTGAVGYAVSNDRSEQAHYVAVASGAP